MISLEFFLLLSFILYAIGLYGLTSKRDIIRLLISLEILINAVLINTIAYSVYYGSAEGVILSIVGISVAAAETTMGLAIAIVIKRHYGTIDIGEVKELKG